MVDALPAPGTLFGGRVTLQLVLGLAALSFFMLVVFPLTPDPSARRSEAPVAWAAAASATAAGLLQVTTRN